MTLFVVLVAGVLCAVFDLLVAKGSSANAYLANTVFNGISALIPLALVLPILFRHPAATTSKTALIYNIGAGITLTAFSIIIVKLFASGNGLGYVLPTIYGTAIALGAVLGVIFLKEKITLLQSVGIACTVVGITLVALAKR